MRLLRLIKAKSNTLKMGIQNNMIISRANLNIQADLERKERVRNSYLIGNTNKKCKKMNGRLEAHSNLVYNLDNHLANIVAE